MQLLTTDAVTATTMSFLSLSQKLWLNFLLFLCVIFVCFKIIITEYSNAPFYAPVPNPSPTNYKL